MGSRRRLNLHYGWGQVAVLLATALSTGCTSTSLDTARHQFYRGRIQQASDSLEKYTPDERNHILYQMERGMILQQSGDYGQSARLLIDAAHHIDAFEAYSISQGTASWVINDTMYRFRGKPYERTLLHAFTALNFFALGQWDSAAVEARRILETLNPEFKGNYPDDPYSRYIAGFAFEMIQDSSNAALQYRYASEQVKNLIIVPETGQLRAESESGVATLDVTHELVCFFHAGHSTHTASTPSNAEFRSSAPLYAELFAEDQYLGRSYTLVDTATLAFLTAREETLRKTAKASGRVAFKKTLAGEIGKKTNDTMGNLTRFILLGLLEQPDLRTWETLPRWLQVARVPCPENLDSIDLVIHYRDGRKSTRHSLNHPICRNGKTYVTFFRHLRGT